MAATVVMFVAAVTVRGNRQVQPRRLQLSMQPIPQQSEYTVKGSAQQAASNLLIG